MRIAGVSRVIIRTDIDSGQVPQRIPVDEEYRFTPGGLTAGFRGCLFCGIL